MNVFVSIFKVVRVPQAFKHSALEQIDILKKVFLV